MPELPTIAFNPAVVAVTCVVVAVLAAAVTWALVKLIRVADRATSDACDAGIAELQTARSEGRAAFTTRPDTTGRAAAPVWELPEPDQETNR